MLLQRKGQSGVASCHIREEAETVLLFLLGQTQPTSLRAEKGLVTEQPIPGSWHRISALYFPKIIDYGWLNFSKESRLISPTKQTFL